MFNVNEVFEVAEQIERNGKAFYEKAASIARDEESRKFLLDLAAMEDDHERYFAALKERLASGDDDPLDRDGVALSYIQSMVDGEVFLNLKPMADTLSGEETMEEIKKLAIEFEKNTVVYFASLKNAMRTAEDKKAIEELVNEELRHVAILTNWDVLGK